MKYAGMPFGMWALFGTSFERNLITVFELDGELPKWLHPRQSKNIRRLSASCRSLKRATASNEHCQLCHAVSLCSLHAGTPGCGKINGLLRQAMMTPTMRWFCRMSGKKKFSRQDIDGMKTTAAFKAADRTPIPGTWNFASTPMTAVMRHGFLSVASAHSCGSWGFLTSSPPCALWITA